MGYELDDDNVREGRQRKERLEAAAGTIISGSRTLAEDLSLDMLVRLQRVIEAANEAKKQATSTRSR